METQRMSVSKKYQLSESHFTAPSLQVIPGIKHTRAAEPLFSESFQRYKVQDTGTKILDLSSRYKV